MPKDETEQFINKYTGSKKAAPEKKYGTTPTTAPNPVVDDDDEEPVPKTIARYLVGIFGFIIFAGSLTCLAIFCVKNKLYDTVWHASYVGFAASFGIVAVFGLFGIIGAVRRSGCLLGFFTFLLGLVSLASVTGIVVALLASHGKLDDVMFTAWKSAVQTDPYTVCGIQKSLQCSGWTEVCNITDFPTDSPGHDHHSVELVVAPTPPPAPPEPTPAPPTLSPTPSPHHSHTPSPGTPAPATPAPATPTPPSPEPSNRSTGSPGTHEPRSTATPEPEWEEECPLCHDDRVQYNTTCRDAIEANLQHHLPVYCGTLGVVLAISIAVILLCVYILRRRPHFESSYERI